PHEPPVPRRHGADRPLDVLAQLQLSTDDASAVRAKLSSLIEVLQSAAASADFLERAARAVAELMALDSAQVLLLEDGQWRSRAEHHRQPAVVVTHFSASRRLLERMRADRRTVWSDGVGDLSGDF